MATASKRKKKPLSRQLREAIDLQRRGNIEAAERVYRQTLAENPEHADALYLLGTLCLNQGRLGEAREHLAHAVARKASLAPAWYELGNTLRDLGEFEAATEAFAKALRQKPDLAVAHCARAQLRDYREPGAFDAELLHMRQAHARARAGSREKRDLAWGLAHALQQRGDAEPTLAYLAEAHAVDAAAQPYDRSNGQQYFQRLRDAIDAQILAERAPRGSETELPLFVIGPPRSGTSLVEQILASHSVIHGAGELRWIGQLCGQMERGSGLPFAEAYRRLPEGEMQRAGNTYLMALARLAPQARRVVDKMPANLLAAGMLGAMFPRARFFYCERDRAATAWSIYSTRFAEAHAFSNDPADLVDYLDTCAVQREYLAELLGERLYTVRYEELVAEPQRVIPDLLAHAGVAMEPACLQPERTQRPVRTASAMQLRRPIYADANNRSRHFIAASAAFRDALEGTL